MDPLDNSENSTHSSVFGISAGLDRGWEQPSSPWFEDLDQDALNAVPAENLPLDTHTLGPNHSTSHSPQSSSFSVNDFETSELTSSNFQNTQKYSLGPPDQKTSSTPPFSFGPVSPASPLRQSSISRHRLSLSSNSLFHPTPNRSRSHLSSAYVDLTEDSPAMPINKGLAKPGRKLSNGLSEIEPPPTKRRRIEDKPASIEEVDLRDVDSESDLARVLERQRAATVRQQQENAEKPTKLAKITCVVCMDEMTNMTATHCGV